MTTALQRRRGTNSNHSSFAGLEGEITVNTTNKSIHVHDGTTAGGFEALRTDLSNITDIETTVTFADTYALEFGSDATPDLTIKTTGNQVQINSNVSALIQYGGANRINLTSAGATYSGTSTFSGNVNVSGTYKVDADKFTSDNMFQIYNTGISNGNGFEIYTGDLSGSSLGGMYKCNSTVGAICIGRGQCGLQFFDAYGSRYIIPYKISDFSSSNDSIDLGGSFAKFDDIYATNGTIQTSDRRLKQDIEELTEAELRVATACKALVRKFRWVNRVEEKGDEARTHIGVIAQDVRDAFSDEGLDASDYALFTEATYWEHDGERYGTAEEAPSGALERTIMGVRYSELLAFIIAAL
jgi:hypothetical protein